MFEILTDDEYRNTYEDYFQTIVPMDAVLSAEEIIMLEAQRAKTAWEIVDWLNNHNPLATETITRFDCRYIAKMVGLYLKSSGIERPILRR